MKVYVAQYTTIDDIEAEADDPSHPDLDVPMFEAVFADFGPKELRTLQDQCVADWNEFCEAEEDKVTVERITWHDGAWVTPPAGRRYTHFRGDLDGDHLFFITVQETDLL